MSIKVDIISQSGNRYAIESTQNIAHNTKRGIERSLFFVGKQLKAEFNKQVLAKDKTGRLYIRKAKNGARRRHIASAAGETPANRTGNYRWAIGAKISGNELAFGNAAEYAGFLEFGTSKMKPRPGLANSIKAQERNILKTLADNIESAI